MDIDLSLYYIYRLGQKGGALIVALLLMLSLCRFDIPAIASQKATISYVPQTVESFQDADSSYEWRSVQNVLDPSLSFAAAPEDFNDTNSVVLTLHGDGSTPQASDGEQYPPVVEGESGADSLPDEEPDNSENGDNTSDSAEDAGVSQGDQTIDEGSVSEGDDEMIVEDESDTSLEEGLEDGAEDVPDNSEVVDDVMVPHEDAPLDDVSNTHDADTDVGDVDTGNESDDASVSVTEHTVAGIVPADRTYTTLDMYTMRMPTTALLQYDAAAYESRTVVLAGSEDAQDTEPVSVESTASPRLTLSHFARTSSQAEDTLFKDATLKVSLAGVLRPQTSLVFEYSLDGVLWQKAGALSFTDPQSNGRNGDYFYLTLQGIDTQDKVEQVLVRVMYQTTSHDTPIGDTDLVWIDSVSIETTSRGQVFDTDNTTLFTPVEENNKEVPVAPVDILTPEERTLARIAYANNIFELLKDGNASEPFKILHQKFLEESPLELSLVGASTTVDAVLEGEHTVRYRDIYPSTDFIYTPTDTGLKEEILLKDGHHPDSFTYILNLSQFDYRQTAPNTIDVYKQGHKDNPLFKIYTISAPYMIDALGQRSEELEFHINGDEVTLVPDADFIQSAVYPILIDPTVEISVITTYAHPLSGEDWTVDFATVGTSDLYIRPRTEATRNDIDFVSLSCDGVAYTAEIQSGETIFYPDWSCDGVGTIVHHVTQEGSHILDFEFGGQTATAFNGTRTWDGEGADNNWSTCANWSGDTCPTSSDSVIFDGTSTKDATIDSATTIIGLSLSAGYTGTVTQASSANLTLTGAYTQAAGTFTGGAATTTYSSNFTITAGTYNAASTTDFVGGGKTLNVPTSQTFGNLSLNLNGTADTLNISNDTLVIQGSLILNTGYISTGALSAMGNIFIGANSSNHSATLDFASSAAQTLTYTGNGMAPQLTLDSADDALDVIDANGQTNPKIGGLTLTSGYSGTFLLLNETSGTTFQIGNGVTTNSFSLSGGTVRGGPGTWDFNRLNFVVNAGATFVAPTTTKLSGGNWTGVNVNTSQTFENLDLSLNSASAALSISNDTLVTTGTLTLTQGYLVNGTLNAQGNIVVGTNSGPHSVTLNFASSAAQTLTYTGNGMAPPLTLDSADDALDTVDANGQTDPVLLGLTTTSGYSGTFSLLNETSGTTFHVGSTNGTYTFSLSGGTVRGGPGTWDFTRLNFSIASGATFVAPTTTKLTGGNWGTIDVNTSQTFENLNLNLNSSGAPISIANGDTFVVTGTTTLTQGSFNNTSATLQVKGDLVFTSGSTGAWTPIVFSGSSLSGKSTQTANFSGATSNYDGDITVNKTEGEVKLLSGLTMNASNQDLVITDGTLYLNGQNLAVNGTSGTFTIANGAVLQLQGGELITANTGYPSFATGSTVEYIGDGDGVSDTHTLIQGLGYKQVTIKTTDAGDTISAHGIPLDINGTFTLQQGTFIAPSTTMTVAGDWINTGGTLDGNGGTVSLDGTSQTISGDNTFANLSKIVSSADTLTYGAGDTQTITGTYTMTGTSGNILSLVSDNPSTQWNIDPQGTRTVEYASVTDSNNINATTLAISEAIVSNGGNNTNWGFNNVPAVSSLGPSAYIDGSWGNDETPTLTFTLTDADAENMQFHIIVDDSSDFSSPLIDYTSVAQAGGATSFTVGQAAGSGSYTTGTAGQTLATGAYYWRVSATDASGGAGATTTAHSGGIAFRIDTTVPTAGNVATSSYAATTATIDISGATDDDSGLAALPYNFHDQTEDTYSGATSSTSYQFTGLLPDTEYVFDVGVADAAGNYATTSSVTQRTLASAPHSPIAVANSDTAITFSWNGATNPPTVTYYPVNITASTTPGYISAKTYQFTGLTCETSYTFEVKAKNSDGIETATTTPTVATTGTCPVEEEDGGSSGSGGGGGSSGGGGNTSPTITYTPVPVAPVTQGIEVYTISVDGSQTTAGGTITSSNRTIYLTFNPPAQTERILIANNPNFDGAQLFEYTPDFAVQWNVCQAADGILLPESQCARNKEYNIYVKFVNNFGLETQVVTQNVFLYDPILPDSYFNLPQQNIVENVYNTERVVTTLDFPFSSPFNSSTGIRTYNYFGNTVDSVLPGYTTHTVSGADISQTGSASERYMQALKSSYTITTHVIGTITKYITQVAGIPGSIRDNYTFNIYTNGIANGFSKIRETTTRLALTSFEWLMGNLQQPSTQIAEDVSTETPHTEGGTDAETSPSDNRGINILITASTQSDSRVRAHVTDVTESLHVSTDDVHTAATVATALAPMVLVAQQTLALALFTGGFAFMDFLFILLRYLHDLLSFLQVRNRRRTWGFVYDAQTKMPLEPALVELIDVKTDKVVDRAVTDRTGQFGFLPRFGTFKIRVTKAHYTFPSTQVTGERDGVYTHVYRGEDFVISETHHLIAPNIPLDMTSEDVQQRMKGLYLKYHLLEHRWGHVIAGLLFWIGALFVLTNLLIARTALNIIIFSFYMILLAYRYIKWGERMWGHIVHMPELPEGTKITMELHHRKMPDTLLARVDVSQDGKFFLKVIEPGTYMLTVKEVASSGTERTLLEEDVAIGKDLVVNHDIYLG